MNKVTLFIVCILASGGVYASCEVDNFSHYSLYEMAHKDGVRNDGDQIANKVKFVKMDTTCRGLANRRNKSKAAYNICKAAWSDGSKGFKKLSCAHFMEIYAPRKNKIKNDDDLFALGKKYYDNGDYSKAFTALYPLAQNENSDAQITIALMYMRESSWENKDFKRGIVWLDKAIKNGNKEAISILNYAKQIDEVNQAGSIIEMKKQCTNGVARACSGLGAKYYTGTHVTKSISEAEKYAKKGCDLKNGESCSIYGVIQEDKGNTAYALSFYKVSCGLKFENGCQLYEELRRKRAK